MVGDAAAAAKAEAEAKGTWQDVLSQLLAALAVAGLLGLAALASSAPDAEGRRKLQFGPAGIIIPAVYPAASAALGQTF